MADFEFKLSDFVGPFSIKNKKWKIPEKQKAFLFFLNRNLQKEYFQKLNEFLNNAKLEGKHCKDFLIFERPTIESYKYNDSFIIKNNRDIYFNKNCFLFTSKIQNRKYIFLFNPESGCYSIIQFKYLLNKGILKDLTEKTNRLYEFFVDDIHILKLMSIEDDFIEVAKKSFIYKVYKGLKSDTKLKFEISYGSLDDLILSYNC